MCVALVCVATPFVALTVVTAAVSGGASEVITPTGTDLEGGEGDGLQAMHTEDEVGHTQLSLVRLTCCPPVEVAGFLVQIGYSNSNPTPGSQGLGCNPGGVGRASGVGITNGGSGFVHLKNRIITKVVIPLVVVMYTHTQPLTLTQPQCMASMTRCASG